MNDMCFFVCVCVLCFVCVTEVDFLIKFEVRATNFFVVSLIPGIVYHV